jgi:tetratricopeptide (TPR) repeat protein
MPLGSTQPPLTTEDGSFHDSELRDALKDMLKGEYEKAIEKFIKKYKKEKNREKKRYVLRRLAQCYREVGKEDFIRFLNEDIRPELSNYDGLYATTLELENLFLLEEKRYDEAITNYTTLISNFSTETSIRKHALFNLGYLHYYQLEDTEKGLAYFDQLKAAYPDDPLTLEAMMLLGEIGRIPPELYFSERSESESAKMIELQLPEKYSLLGNYPNPFNPSTQISYSLPYRSAIELVIYDVMGRKVKAFKIGSQSAGYQDITWNGQNEYGNQVSSGIYVYRLKITSLENDEVFMKTSKMIMLK